MGAVGLGPLGLRLGLGFGLGWGLGLGLDLGWRLSGPGHLRLAPAWAWAWACRLGVIGASEGNYSMYFAESVRQNAQITNIWGTQGPR